MEPVKKSLMLLNACGNYDARIIGLMEERGVSWDDLSSGSRSAMDLMVMADPVRGNILELLSTGWPDKEMERCERTGVRVIFFPDPDYPRELRNINDPPLLLYSRGGSIPRGEKVAVVGTRKCTSYGSGCASGLASAMAEAGVTVVSGGARGIDGSAHRGCLDSGGKTIAVTGTGVDIAYPASHASLFREIMEEGAILSEYPLGTSPRPWNFPRRNRIIAGLCSRCVVVEAPEKSGAIITARYALEAGRDVWAVPGRINERSCRGSNALISDGASPLVDIISFVSLVSGRQLGLFSQEDPEAGMAGFSLAPEEREVFRILADEGDMTVDNIATKGKMSAAAVLRVIGVLSAYGLVLASGPGRWCVAVSGRDRPIQALDRRKKDAR